MKQVVTLSVMIAVLAIGCDKDGAVVNSNEGSNQLKILSHDFSSIGSYFTTYDPDSSLLISVSVNNNPAISNVNFVNSVELRHNLNTNINGRFLSKYLDYGSLKVSGTVITKSQSTSMIDVPEQNGVPAHTDTIDYTTYKENTQSNQLINLVANNGKVTITGQNSEQINDFTFDFSMPDPLLFTDMDSHQVFADNQDLIIKLNRPSSSGLVLMFPANPNYNDALPGGYESTIFKYNFETDEIVISAQELKELSSKWKNAVNEYIIAIGEEHFPGSLITTDKLTGKQYGIPVEMDYWLSTKIELTKQ